MASDPPTAGEAEAVPAGSAAAASGTPSAAATPTGSTILAIPFSFAGTLTPGLLSMRFPLSGTWTFSDVSIACVDPPTVSAVVLDVLFNAQSIYGSPAARPQVLAGHRKGTSASRPAIVDFHGTAAEPGVFACSITHVGSGDPGGDLTLALYLTSA
jgi:hypothetical protein